MPFEDPKDFSPKRTLKQVGEQKSMFDGKPKPPSPQEFEQKVKAVEEKKSSHKVRAHDLFVKFQAAIQDKTLAVNRNIFQLEAERELLINMIQLAEDVNNDPNEQEAMGSLAIITCVLKACLAQRDKINELDYNLEQLKKQLNSTALADYINKEITKALDDKKKSG